MDYLWVINCAMKFKIVLKIIATWFSNKNIIDIFNLKVKKRMRR
jgi:hypothetical protein